MNPVTARERRKEGKCQNKCRMLSGVVRSDKGIGGDKGVSHVR